MKLGLVGGLAGIGLLALTGYSQAAVLTIDLDNYASAVDTTPGVLMATMVVTDLSGGGVSVKITLDAATYFASTGNHITVAWNLDKAEGAITGLPSLAYLHRRGDLQPAGLRCQLWHLRQYWPPRHLVRHQQPLRWAAQLRHCWDHHRRLREQLRRVHGGDRRSRARRHWRNRWRRDA